MNVHSHILSMSRSSFLKPGRWLTAGVILLGLMLVWLGGVVFELAKENEKQVVLAKLASIGQRKVAYLDAFLKERKGDAQVLSKLLSAGLAEGWWGARGDLPVALHKPLQAAVVGYEYAGILILDAKGGVRYGIGDSVGLTAAGKSLALRVSQDVSAEFSEIYYAAPERPQHPMMDTFSPILNRDGTMIQGILVLRGDWSRLFSLTQPWPAESRTAETLLIRQDGDDVLFLNELRHQKNTALQLRLPLSGDALRPATPSVRAVKGLYGALEAKDYRDVPVLSHSFAVPGTGWSMVVKEDVEEALEGVHRAARTVLVGILLVMVFSALLMGSWWWWRRRILEQEFGEKLRTEQRISSIVDSALDGVITVDETQRIVLFNPMAARIFGCPAEEAIGQPLDRFIPARFRDAHREHIRGFGQSGTSSRRMNAPGDVVGLRGDGSEFPIEASISQTQIDGQKFYTAIVRDITVRKAAEKALLHANRAYRVISEVNRAMVQLHEEHALLDAVCHVLVETGGYRLAWIGFAQEDARKSVRPVASTGYEAGYLDQLDVTWADEPHGHGPTGTAIRLNQVVAARHIFTDPDYEPWRAEALKRGYASSVALPLISANGVMGALNIYAQEEDAFEADEIELLRQLAADLVFSLEVLRNAQNARAVEQALQRTSAEWEYAMGAFQDPIYLLDVQRRFLRANQAFYKMVGATAEQLVGRHIADILHPHGETVPCPVCQAQEEKRDVTLLMEADHPDNPAGIPIEVNCRIIRDTHQTPVGILMSLHDLTESRAEAERLRRSEAQLEEAQRIAHVGSWEWDIVGGGLTWSDETYRIFGFKPQQFGATYEAFLKATHPEDRDKVVQAMNDAVALGSPYNTEHRINLPDGYVRFVHEQGEVRCGQDGRSLCMIGTVQDITPQKMAERMVRESEQQFRATFEQAAVGMAQVTPDGHWLRVNQKLCEIVGYSEEELKNITFQDATHPDDLDKDLMLVQAVLAGERDSYSMEKRYLKPDGAITWVNLTVALVREKDGTPKYFVSVVEDINARKEAEARIERAMVEKDTMLLELHHRVKNNLQMVSSMLSLQSREVEDGAVMEAFADTRNRIRAMALVHEKLYGVEDLGRVNFRDYLNYLLQRLARVYSAHHFGLKLVVESDKVRLNIDQAVPCGIIVNELVTNALKHASHEQGGGVVTVGLFDLGKEGYSLVVSQSGRGFDPVAAEGGHTLGLKIVRALARQLQGGVTFRNQDGMKIEVRFP